jgi:glycosyltransferase involved in cell wall biosynthesis
MDRSRTRLLYFGSATHANDLEIVRAATKALEDRVIVTVVGGAPAGKLKWCEQIVPDRAWNQYPDFVGRLRSLAKSCDIAVIPLADTEFNRAKSDLKFLEASALGLPVIGSDVKAYGATIEDARTGLLVDNDPLEWASAIERLHADSSLRRDLTSAALDYVSSERLLKQHVHESEAFLDSLLTRFDG